MAKQRHSAASRDSGTARLFRWLMLALVGAGGGMMLGDLAVGSRTNGLAEERPSYASLSANPDALTLQSGGSPPCADCADSYGAAKPWRAQRDARMSDEFRALGAVAVDVDPPVTDPADDYRFGGRFADSDLDDRDATIAIDETPSPSPAGDIPPASETPSSLPNSDF